MTRAPITLVVVLVAGCYDAPKPACGFRCGPLAACPADYTCASDSRCHLNGSPADLVCATPDAMPPYSPRVVFTSPTAGAMADPSTQILVRFDTDVAGVTSTSFTVTTTSTTTPVIGTIVYNAPMHEATFARQGGLPPNEELLVALSENIFDPETNLMLMPTSYTFRTGPDTTPPMIVATSPLNGATGELVITNVNVQFDEEVTNVNAATLQLLDDGAVQLPGTVSYFSGNRTASFDPQDQLLPNKQYTGLVTTGVTDVVGNPLAQQYLFSFMTGADTFSPNVRVTMPAQADTNVPVNSNIVVTFDEPVMGVDTTSFQLDGGAIAGTVTMSNGNKTATFDPTADLPAASTIVVTLSAAILDTSTNAMTATMFSFTTM